MDIVVLFGKLAFSQLPERKIQIPIRYGELWSSAGLHEGRLITATIKCLAHHGRC